MQDGFDCIKGKSHYSSIKERDDDLNRLYYLTVRTVKSMITKKRYTPELDPRKLHCILVLAKKLEKIGDNQKRFARGLQHLTVSKKIQMEISAVYEQIQ